MKTFTLTAIFIFIVAVGSLTAQSFYLPDTLESFVVTWNHDNPKQEVIEFTLHAESDGWDFTLGPIHEKRIEVFRDVFRDSSVITVTASNEHGTSIPSNPVTLYFITPETFELDSVSFNQYELAKFAYGATDKDNMGSGGLRLFVPGEGQPDFEHGYINIPLHFSAGVYAFQVHYQGSKFSLEVLGQSRFEVNASYPGMWLYEREMNIPLGKHTIEIRAMGNSGKIGWFRIKNMGVGETPLAPTSITVEW